MQMAGHTASAETGGGGERASSQVAHIEDGHVFAVKPEAGDVEAGAHEAARVAAQVQDVALRALALRRATSMCRKRDCCREMKMRMSGPDC